MDISKALTMAKQLKNHFRVFEELEEFMREAVALQNVVKEFDTRKDDLEEKITILQQGKINLEADSKACEEREEKRFHKRLTELNEKLSTREKEVDEAIREIEGKEGKVKASLDMAYMLHKDEVEKMQQETASAEATLKAVEKKIEDIKTKLE